MKEISGFLNRFNNIAIKEIRKREIISMEINNLIKQKIDIKDLSINNGVLIIKGNQTLKSEIFLKKEKLLDLISKKIEDRIYDVK